jgi:hypothetical protein
MNAAPVLSVVAPVYNEEKGIVEFHRRLSAALHAMGGALGGELDALVQRWPRDPRVRFVRAAARINSDNPAGAEDDLRAALADDRVLRTGFRDRRLEIEVRTLLAQVLTQRGEEAEARAVVAPICHLGAQGRAPTGLTLLGLCERP